MKIRKHIDKITIETTYKISYEYTNIIESDRISICTEYLTYIDYMHIEYYSYVYCIMYNYEVMDEDTEFIDDDNSSGYFLEKDGLLIIDEKIMSFEEIYLDLLTIKKKKIRDEKLKELGI
jgi:hypothetical protein